MIHEPKNIKNKDLDKHERKNEDKEYNIIKDEFKEYKEEDEIFKDMNNDNDNNDNDLKNNMPIYMERYCNCKGYVI